MGRIKRYLGLFALGKKWGRVKFVLSFLFVFCGVFEVGGLDLFGFAVIL